MTNFSETSGSPYKLNKILVKPEPGAIIRKYTHLIANLFRNSIVQGFMQPTIFSETPCFPYNLVQTFKLNIEETLLYCLLYSLVAEQKDIFK